MRYLLLSQQDSTLGFTPDGEARTGDGRAFLSSQQWFVRALILVGMQTSFQGAMKRYRLRDGGMGILTPVIYQSHGAVNFCGWQMTAPLSDSDATTPPDSGPSEEFVRLFTQVQRALYLSIMPMVRSPSDAEEVLQEANVVILNKWRQFQPGSNFLAWCRAIARLEVFRFRRRNFHRIQLLDDDVMQLIAEKIEEEALDVEQHRRILMDCLSRLREPDQELIRRRYTQGVTGDEVASQLGRPANSVYQSLGRIRRMLLECMRRRLASGGAT